MKVTRNPNGSILLEPEDDDEKEGIEYEYNRRGSTWLKEMMEKHVKQRKDQKEYERIIEIKDTLNDLSEADKLDVIAKLKVEVGKKPKKNAK